MRRGSVCFHTSPSGLRMVHLAVPGAAVGYCGVAVRVGSRDEEPGLYGLAHFVEHTIFKGTAKRRAWHIINRMEAVGGELNAYTTKEETVVFSAFPKGNLSRAAELIADLIVNSQFPARELDKEREVVADEIDSYLDSPSEAVFDDFEDLMFADSELGHNVLGNREALAKFSSEVCRSYLKKWYVPQNMVVFYAGSLSPDSVFALLERCFASVCGSVPGSERVKPKSVQPFERWKEIDSHQCHTIVGAPIGSMTSPDQYATSLLVNLLGGPGMNSLLNVALRERRGLVYSVDATTGVYSDCGALAIYYGCDPDDNSRCRRLVADTIASVAEGYLTPRRLELAKKQYLGQLVIAGENIENRILSFARQYLFMGHVITRSEMLQSIQDITPSQIASLASTLSLSSLTLGPRK